MTDIWNFCLGTISETVTWLGSWQWHGVSFLAYLIGFTILSILIDRIFN